MDKWIYGITVSRNRVSFGKDITPQLIQEVNRRDLYNDFCIRPGTINVILEEGIKFCWEKMLPKIYWFATGVCAKVKLKECIFECKTDEGWKSSRAFLYDPCNPNDTYLGLPTHWELFAEKEFDKIRCVGKTQGVKIRIQRFN